MNKDSTYETTVPALERALDILEFLQTCDEPPTLSEIVTRLQVPKASAHRLLLTLKERGYVVQGRRRGGFALGARVLGIAARAQSQIDLVAIAVPRMRALAEATGEGCQLTIRSGEQALCVARVASPAHPDVSLVGRVGSMFPLHAVAVGKVLLAFASEQERADYAQRKLTAFTPQTRTEPDALHAELDRIVAARVAYDREEYKAGLGAIAAPVWAHTGALAGAVAVPFLIASGEDSKWETVEQAVREAARAVSRDLGYYEEEA